MPQRTKLLSRKGQNEPLLLAKIHYFLKCTLERYNDHIEWPFTIPMLQAMELRPFFHHAIKIFLAPTLRSSKNHWAIICNEKQGWDHPSFKLRRCVVVDWAFHQQFLPYNSGGQSIIDHQVFKNFILCLEIQCSVEQEKMCQHENLNPLPEWLENIAQVGSS